MQNAARIGARSLFALFLALASQSVHASKCTEMADMAKDIAKIHDMGVSLADVDKRLQRDVKNDDERAVAMMAARLVYSTEGTPAQIEAAVLAKCKKG